MKHQTLIIVLVCMICGALHAQDTDPFFAGRNPMQLDPSRTGFDPGGRFTVVHQDQWLQFPGSWRADQLNAEWAIRNTKKPTGAWLGVGLSAASEKQGAVGSRMSTVGLAPAMHLRSGQRAYLSAGLELRWLHAVFNDGSGAWGSQYDGTRYDASINAGEQWNTSNSSSMEARIGLSWTLKQHAESPRRRERDLLIVGLSADHLGRLMLQENGAPPPMIPMRFSAYVLSEVPHEIWDNGFFSGELIGHVQGPFHTARLNVYAGKHLLNTTRQPGGPMLLGFKAGLGYRLQDALLVNAALDIGKITFGMAYGWAVVNSNTLAAGRRTFEVMLQLRTVG